MNFIRATILRLGLSLLLVTSVFSGAVAQADSATTKLPSPPTSKYVVLGSYGSLPVVVLDLTQSAINMNMTVGSMCYGTNLPLAAGLPGVYMNNGGSTAKFNNILTPNDSNMASLVPQVILNTATNDITVNSAASYGWMSLFTLFPSWSQPGSYNQVEYQTLSGVTNQGAAGATMGNIVSGYPDGNSQNATGSGHFVTANALNASIAIHNYLNLNLLDNSGNTAATYKIDINSLGGGTSGNIPKESTGASILQAMHSALDIVTNFVTIASGDPLGIIDYVAGLPATISGAVSQGASANAGVVTASAYKASSLGINISASATFNDTNGEALIPYEGDSQAIFYQVQSVSNQTIPLIQQNGVIITTFRQKPSLDMMYDVPNSADTLFVMIVNQGVYASNQIQNYINNNPPQTAGVSLHKPTKDQAMDSVKILGILTAIAQKSPQDAKAIIDMFGIHGKYQQLKNNPGAVKTLNSQLKGIFDKYSKELPAAAVYSAKLAQR